MSILVTGAAGYIGSALAEALVSSGARVVATDQSAPRTEGAVTGNLAYPPFARSLITPEIGAVFHLASLVSGGAEQNFELGMKVNLDATRDLLEACRLAGHRPRFVFASSIAVYGGKLPDPVTDDTPDDRFGGKGEAMTQKTGILLCGHGSRDANAIREFAVLAKMLAQRLPDVDVDHGFLEFARPVLRDITIRLEPGIELHAWAPRRERPDACLVRARLGREREGHQRPPVKAALEGDHGGHPLGAQPVEEVADGARAHHSERRAAERIRRLRLLEHSPEHEQHHDGDDAEHPARRVAHVHAERRAPVVGEGELHQLADELDVGVDGEDEVVAVLGRDVILRRHRELDARSG